MVYLSKTFYINKVSKSQPSCSYRPLYGRGLRKWTRPSHTHTPINRQVIQPSWKESWLCLVARENNPYHEQRLMHSPQNKERVFTHSFHFRSLWWEYASRDWRQRRVPNQRLKYCALHGTHTTSFFCTNTSSKPSLRRSGLIQISDSPDRQILKILFPADHVLWKTFRKVVCADDGAERDGTYITQLRSLGCCALSLTLEP